MTEYMKKFGIYRKSRFKIMQVKLMQLTIAHGVYTV